MLKNSGSFNFDFLWQIIYQGKKIGGHSSSGASGSETAARRAGALPPYISVSQMQGVAPQEGSVDLTIEYAPSETHALDGCLLKMMIPSAKKTTKGIDESCYMLELSGRARRPQVDFSFNSHDFGYCFINNRRAATLAAAPGSPRSNNECFKKIDLVVTNRDLSDCLLSTTFVRTPYMDVKLDQSMIEAGQALVVPIIFSPRDAVEYRERRDFCGFDYQKSF